MEGRNPKEERDHKSEMKDSKLKDLYMNKKGKIFEQYVAYSLAIELENINYKTGRDYSLKKEIDRLTKYSNNEKKDIQNKLNSKISLYMKECPKEIQSSSTYSSEKGENNSDNKKINVKGDFDVIIPNVDKNKFNNMLDTCFQKNGNQKFIVGSERNLPKTFNLFAEVGLNVFTNEFSKKKKTNQKIPIHFKFSQYFQRI